ncbi:hypothetical protein CEY11_22030 [Candidimonas nitroreducens]|uniref:citrate synthase (unknown stereospecificity) n=2 Tax=Candidimonas nitroreducens TaxID=683354 RepID=A0A225M3L4_9BURK|nr:hypothetical protein CEY11_22030 [Candidimonas nitroreducens]
MLGIKKESLYTYVSRGLIKTLPEPGKRTHLYRKSDLEKLSTRAGAKAGGAPVAQALRYGEPVVQTWICDISPAGPYYRGHLATTLASEGRPFEYVADLLWGGLPPGRDRPWPRVEVDLTATLNGNVAQGDKGSFSPIRLLAMAALHLSALEIAEDTAGRSDVRMSGVQLISSFAGVSGYFGSARTYQPAEDEEFVAQRILRGFGLSHCPGQDKLLAIMHAALVLSADNELSAPTFCARIASSAGVDVYASVASALMAQAGPMQAGGMLDLGQYLTEMLTQEDRPAAYASIPCFGHPLYDRDPRAELLLDMIQDLPGEAVIKERLQRFVSAVHQNAGTYPNLFGALVILLRVLGLPASAAVYLHCVGRTAGWIAHAAEQRLSGLMLRPRARYMGARTTRSV